MTDGFETMNEGFRLLAKARELDERCAAGLNRILEDLRRPGEERWLCRCARVNIGDFRYCPSCGCSQELGRQVTDTVSSGLAKDAEE